VRGERGLWASRVRTLRSHCGLLEEKDTEERVQLPAAAAAAAAASAAVHGGSQRPPPLGPSV
jgi:hypothetical protein